MHHEVNQLMIGMEVLATLRLFELKHEELACDVDSRGLKGEGKGKIHGRSSGLLRQQ